MQYLVMRAAPKHRQSRRAFFSVRNRLNSRKEVLSVNERQWFIYRRSQPEWADEPMYYARNAITNIRAYIAASDIERIADTRK